MFAHSQTFLFGLGYSEILNRKPCVMIWRTFVSFSRWTTTKDRPRFRNQIGSGHRWRTKQSYPLVVPVEVYGQNTHRFESYCKFKGAWLSTKALQAMSGTRTTSNFGFLFFWVLLITLRWMSTFFLGQFELCLKDSTRSRNRWQISYSWQISEPWNLKYPIFARGRHFGNEIEECTQRSEISWLNL